MTHEEQTLREQWVKKLRDWGIEDHIPGIVAIIRGEQKALLERLRVQEMHSYKEGMERFEAGETGLVRPGLGMEFMDITWNTMAADFNGKIDAELKQIEEQEKGS